MTSKERSTSESQDDANVSGDCEAHFEPLVSLPLVEKKTFEEDEDVLYKMRAKLFVFGPDVDGEMGWKERGVGDVKVLENRISKQIRLLMRREKTLKICCNHFITPDLELKPHVSSDKAWVWSSASDFSDGETKHELFAIRFGTPQKASDFHKAFDEARETMKLRGADDNGGGSSPSKDDTGSADTSTNGHDKNANDEEQPTTSPSKTNEVDSKPSPDDVDVALAKLELKEESKT